jgi:hypothetical protein
MFYVNLWVDRTHVLLASVTTGDRRSPTVKNAFRVYTSAVPVGSPAGPAPCSAAGWKSFVTLQHPSGRVLAEFSEPIAAEPGHTGSPTAHRDASMNAALQGLVAARKARARNVIVYSDSPPAVEALNRSTPPSRASVGVHLQVRALSHSFRAAQFHYSPYPSISDVPAMASGC